jgi:uncharacterized membrane protein (UPF0127 family)
MKNPLKTALVIVCFLALAAVLDHIRTESAPETAVSRDDITIMVAGAPLTLEIAATDEARERGLSEREVLASGTGMLFIFDEAALHGFWMPDMHFSIDIAWLDDNFCFVTIEKAVSPDSYPTVYVPAAPARYVIETSAGFFAAHDVSRGDCLEKPKL